LIPDILKKFMSEKFDKEYDGAVGVLASLTTEGKPNASPKHFRIRDENHLEFTDVFSATMGDDLRKTPHVSVVFFDPERVIGFRVKGKASLETFGALFHQAASQLEHIGLKPKALVSIYIDEIQSLSYGPNTGRRLVGHLSGR